MDNVLLFISLAVFLTVLLSISVLIAHLVHKYQIAYTMKRCLEYTFYKTFLGRLILGIFIIILLLLGGGRGLQNR